MSRRTDAMTHDPLNLLQRPRRNRKHPAIRAFVRETTLGPEHFIYPLFIHAGDDDVPIASMPGCARLSRKGLLAEVEAARAVGVNIIALFPAVAEALKTSDGREAWNPNGLIPATIKALKDRWPDLVIVTDVALDPYNSDGHDGIVAPDGRILNDETVEALCNQALCQARAGADIVAPSDMMDGRVQALREALDGEGFTDASILAYTAKYASAFYGPFRDALDSAPKSGDKKTYQMDPANAREALREAELDEVEGADILMVKPAGPYLDILAALRRASNLPLAAYQVSGEYAMLKAASERGWLDEKRVVLESLLGIRRAGADVIFTYFARQAAEWLTGARK
ncbi:porphobilinogen synthase [Nannocystis sp. ILAH1]|uniref:porphobilinogen synthase n=1 Tax=unclassified Nannocystis TaxID=2627009 RepID=UPI00226E699B|nr:MULTISPECIES: porphobilinogen synthase [unclassified Nannocystis]MCY0995274.1 porphobilinogen synthase [Nannocystis sp. ILAH1]MCY1066030.1 porphobilinogen synthase [Nannocystis sp. RBIL2]